MRTRKWAKAAILPLMGVFASAGAATAADLSPAPVIEGAAPVVSWQGFYAGVNAGYGWGLADHLASITSGTGVNDLSINGWLAGGQVGVNWQSANNLVLGLEADIDWANISGACANPNCHPTGGGGAPSTSHKINWMGTGRLRVGYAMGNVLPYLTGGVAFANATRTTAFGGGSSFSATHNGWVAGGGVEVLFAGDWSIKGEYQYADLGMKTYAFPVGGFDPDVKLTVSTFRLGLNKHF